MDFEWDDAKNAANLEKHGITFETAITIFNGPVLTRLDERENYGEVREISMGLMGTAYIVVVIHTDRNGITRIISARRANKSERNAYHEYITKITE